MSMPWEFSDTGWPVLSHPTSFPLSLSPSVCLSPLALWKITVVPLARGGCGTHRPDRCLPSGWCNSTQRREPLETWLSLSEKTGGRERGGERITIE